MPRPLRSMLLCVFACSSILAAQTSSLEGDWISVISHFDQKNYTRCKIEQNGAKLTLTYQGTTLSGSVDDGKVTLEGKDDRGGAVKASGAIEAGEIHGNVH